MMRDEALDGRDDLEQVLLLLDAHLQVRGDRVGQARRVVHAHGGDHRVVLQVVRELDVLLEERDDAAHDALRRRPAASAFFGIIFTVTR